MTEKRLDEVILAEAIKARATDIHIDPTLNGYTVRMRIDGKLRSRMTFNKKEGERLMNQMKVTCGMDSGAVFQPASGRCKLKFDERILDLRVSLVPCISGSKLSIRLLEATNVQQKLSTLGLTEDQSEKLKRWLFELNGMIMVTGPTGSGKTTTLYAMLKELVEEARHVVTVEDPVEYQIDGINQIEVNLHHDLTFAKAVKASLRMDPDCLMVGEIRELETAQESINAAITGHVVMATMHSRDAVSTITRLREFRLENHQIAAALGVVVNQRLIAKLCKNCSVKREASSIEKAFFESRFLNAPKTVTEATGCSECSGTGIMGRIGIFEVWNLDEEDYQLILEGADEERIRAKLSKSGHTYLLDDALAKVNQGLISAAEVMHMGISLPWENK